MISEKVLMKMDQYGGSFVKNLATLYRSADAINREKLETTFAGYFKEYKEF